MAKLDNNRLLAIKAEINLAEKLNHEEMEPLVAEALERYTGVHIPRYGANWDIILNEIYPVIQFHLPSTFFRNPRAFLKPRNKTFIAKRRNPQTGQMEEVTLDSGKSARTQEALLNYMISTMGYKPQVRKVLLDALLFPFGVLWHGYKGNFGMTEEQSLYIEDEQIFVRRINPLRFIKDPSVNISNIDEAKWVGRILDIPLVDLLDDDQLDVDKNLIKGKIGYGDKVGTKEILAKAALLGGTAGMDYYQITRLKKNMIDYADKDFQNSKAARFVRVYEIYLRPTKKEMRDGEKGKILLLTDEQPSPLRVNDWTIKAKGWPAHILQFNELPDHPFGMPDIDTYKTIADHKNIITNLQIRNAQENTKNWVGISKEGISGEESIEQYQKGENTIVMFEAGNPRDRMFVASPGSGASSELYIIDQRIQRNLEDKSGVTDLKRGFLQSGEESATSVKIRNAGGGARPAYRQDIMADFLKASFSYLNDLNKQFMTIDEAVRIIGSLDVQWSDNPSKEEIQAPTDVEIDVISMLPEDPQNELRNLNTLLMLQIQALTTPAVMAQLQKENKKFNMGPVIEQILLRMKVNDPTIFMNIPQQESEGMVAVKGLREAEQNVQAALTGQQVPFPPQPADDHRAKLEVYNSIANLLNMAGQVSDALNQLIQIHQVFLQKIEEQQAQPGEVIKFSKPTVETVR